MFHLLKNASLADKVSFFVSLRQPILFFCFILVFSTCSNDTSRFRGKAFYFPIEELKNGKVYEFASSDPNSPPFYYYYRTIEEGDGTILTNMQYDYEYQPFQFSRARIYENGVVLKDQKLFFPDTTTNKQFEIPVTIEYGNTFPFEVNEESGVLLTKIAWEGPQADRRTELTRNRRYIRDTTWTFGGQPVDALYFDLKEQIRVEEDGGTDIEYSGWEIYGKGIGLLHFRKEISETFVVEYSLKDTFAMSELEQRFQKHIQK